MNTTLEKPMNETSSGPQRYVTPVTMITKTSDEAYVIEAEMPGVSKEGIEISVEANELTLIGHKQTVEGSGRPVYREITRADYRRVFELDGSIDTTKITARIENGLLTVRLPMSEAVKPRKIEIEG
jgi:HSP20 family protein